MSEALRALYEGNEERARAVLPADHELSVFEAAAFGRVERLRALLVEDPSTAQARAPDGFTALHLAVFGRQGDAARALLEQGADVEALSEGSIAHVRPLGTAAFVRSPALVRLLLDAGADPNGRAGDGSTPLHTTAASGDLELVELLVERGADPTIANDDGTLPRDLATSEAVLARLEA